MLIRETTGTPFERGKQRGVADTDQIRAFYGRFCQGLSLEHAETRDKVKRVESNMRRTCPEVLEELAGVAAGSDLKYEEILLLNCSVDLGAIDHLAHCTNFIMVGTPHGMLHGQQHDVDPTNAMPFVTGEHVHLDDGTLLKRIVWVGSAWGGIGVNSRGLSLGESTVWVRDTNWETGIPINILAGLPLMRCGRVSEAIELLQEIAPINYGYNFACTDVTGDAAIIERSPTRCAVRRLEGRALWCTNYYYESPMQELMAHAPDIIGNSKARWRNLAQIANDAEWSWDMDGMQAALRDHTEPGGICQHAGPGQADLCSSHSFIMVPSQNLLLLTDGLPCKHPYLPSQAWLE